MKDFIEEWVKKIKSLFIPKEVLPLTSENAQSITFYGKSHNYEEMVGLLKQDIYRSINFMSFRGNNYAVIDVPEWLKEDSYDDITEELKKLGFRIKKSDEPHLLIIYWITKKV